MAIVESIMDKSIQLTHDDKAKREELIDKLVIKVTEAGRRKKFEDLDVDPMVKIFIAFLDSHSDAELLMQSADRWADFQAWVRQNNGQKKPIEFEAGSGEVNIDMMEIPVSIKAFDTVMGSASANIDVVSQWSYIKLTSPIRYKYTHKIRSLF